MAQTMVFNLDSEVQSRQWIHLHGDIPGLWAQAHGALYTVRGDGRAAQQWFGGVLRTAVLFSQQIVLTDAQLIDGVFFQALTAPGTLELLGMPLAERPGIRVRRYCQILWMSLLRQPAGWLGRRGLVRRVCRL